MKHLSGSLMVLIVLLGSTIANAQQVTPTPVVPRIPVILDTDIGDDIDDTWALGLILASPELDLKLVVTGSHDSPDKARLAARFLETVGRSDIPIAIGNDPENQPGPQYAWAEDYDLSTYPGTVYEDATQAIVQTVMLSPEPVSLLVLGPCQNIHALLQQAPNIVDQVKVFAMSGSVDWGYGTSVTPDAEYNVRDDIPAARAMYTARWPLTIAPLDTTTSVRLGGLRYQDMLRKGDVLIETIMENYRAFASDKPRIDTQIGSTILYDIVPVYLAMAHHPWIESFIEMEPIRLSVDYRGYTVRDGNAKMVSVAKSWKNLRGYHNWVMNRLENGVYIPDE